MRIDFYAYADDCTVLGAVTLATDRLTELLSEAGELPIEAASFRALDDGRVVWTPLATILRSDLCAVAAAGPRGASQRRVRTRLQPTRAKVGPYSIVGYIHAPPAADALTTALRRRIVPLTSASIEYQVDGRLIEESHEALLVSRDRIDWLAAATDEDIRLPREFAGRRKLDPDAKDLTGAIVG